MAALSPQDDRFITQVLALAMQSRREGHHPFAAMVVAANGEVLAQAMNASSADRTAHAEMNALSMASSKYAPAELADATLYTSAEPCAMCAGGAYWVGVGRVVYALAESRLLELTGNDPENPTLSLPCRAVFACGQRNVEVIGPVREEEAAQAHAGFWKSGPDPCGNFACVVTPLA